MPRLDRFPIRKSKSKRDHYTHCFWPVKNPEIHTLMVNFRFVVLKIIKFLVLRAWRDFRDFWTRSFLEKSHSRIDFNFAFFVFLAKIDHFLIILKSFSYS